MSLEMVSEKKMVLHTRIGYLNSYWSVLLFIIIFAVVPILLGDIQFLLLMVLVAAALAFLMLQMERTITLDKSSGKMFLEWKTILGVKKSTIPLNKIAKLRVELPHGETFIGPDMRFLAADGSTLASIKLVSINAVKVAEFLEVPLKSPYVMLNSAFNEIFGKKKKP